MRWASAVQDRLPPATADADEIRRAAREILARPEFREPPRSLYQRALDWIGDRIADVVDALVRGGAGTVVAWVLLAAVVAAAVYLVARVVRSGPLRRRRSDEPEAPVLDADRDDRRPAAAWEAEAVRLEAAGDWRGVIRCRYRSLIASLASAGVVDEDPGRTAGEYRAVVSATAAAAADPFAGATEVFERAWYGDEAADGAAAARMGQLAERVATGVSG